MTASRQAPHSPLPKPDTTSCASSFSSAAVVSALAALRSVCTPNQMSRVTASRSSRGIPKVGTTCTGGFVHSGAPLGGPETRAGRAGQQGWTCDVRLSTLSARPADNRSTGGCFCTVTFHLPQPQPPRDFTLLSTRPLHCSPSRPPARPPHSRPRHWLGPLAHPSTTCPTHPAPLTPPPATHRTSSSRCSVRPSPTEMTVMTASAPKVPANTRERGCCRASSTAMKKVLSPISEKKMSSSA